MKVQELLENYKQIRARLRYPPNAVPDTGINLRPTKTEVPVPEPEVLPAPLIEETPAPPKPPLVKGLTFSSTLDITAKEFGITRAEICAKTRIKGIAFPRQIAVYIATEKHGRGLSWVGRYLDMDHSTILYSRNKIRSLVSSDPVAKTKIDDLENKIALYAAATLSPNSQPHLEAQPKRNVSLTPVPSVD